MLKYEPNFFVPCDNLRNAFNSPILCKNEPLNAGFLAMNLLNELLSLEQKEVLTLNENISQILPGKLREKVTIVTLKNETLILKTNSSVWRAEILAKKTSIVSACNKILGKVAVKTIKI
jgi:hypothetical protein